MFWFYLIATFLIVWIIGMLLMLALPLWLGMLLEFLIGLPLYFTVFHLRNKGLL